MTDYTNMNAGEMLTAVGMNGEKWTDAFYQTFPDAGERVDRETMLGWFCNAIMAGYDHGARHTRERSNFHKVLEFHTIYGQPIAPMPSTKGVDRARENLRNGFVIEEFCELLDAQGYPSEAAALIQAAWDQVKTMEKTGEADIVEIADAFADLKYFIYGSEVEYGINADDVFKEVHDSNLSKLGTDGKPIYRDDGKVMKGPAFFKPNIRSVLDFQQPLI